MVKYLDFFGDDFRDEGSFLDVIQSELHKEQSEMHDMKKKLKRLKKEGGSKKR